MPEAADVKARMVLAKRILGTGLVLVLGIRLLEY